MFNADEPPNFSGDYPLKGEKIGPAWRAAWRLLSDGRWHGKLKVQAVMCEAGPVVPVTVTNLLHQARRAGVLQARRTTRPDGGCGPSDYRIRRSAK